MALKDWKKTLTLNRVNRWERKNPKDFVTIRYIGDLENKRTGHYDFDVFKKDIVKIKTKTQALRKAKSYMRKH